MALLNFNAADVAPSEQYDPIPEGWYSVRITGSEMKPTKNGAGQYLELKLQVIEGKHANRILFDRLNLKNDNTQAVEIARRTLSSICHATGVIQAQDSQQLHGIPMEARVSIRPASGQYDAANEVKGYRKIGAGQGVVAPAFAPQPAATPTQPPAPMAGSTPPWA